MFHIMFVTASRANVKTDEFVVKRESVGLSHDWLNESWKGILKGLMGLYYMVSDFKSKLNCGCIDIGSYI